MAAQKGKKIVDWDFWHFRMPTNLQTQLIKIHNSLDSSRPYGWLLENPKTYDSRKLFLPENDFKTYSTVNYRKWLKNQNLWFLEFYFHFEVHIQQRWHLTRGHCSWSVIKTKKTEHFKIKKYIMAAKLFCYRLQ